MRASDRDRAVIETVLADAFADGRLDPRRVRRARQAALTRAADPRPQLVHLVRSALPVWARAPVVAAADLHEQAVRKWEADRREALVGLVGISVLIWTIWAVTMWGGFPWPLFPMLAPL